MKLFLLFIAGLTLVAAKAVYEPINTNYHETVGIPLLERLKQAEAAQDFDGSRIIGGQLATLGAHPYQVILDVSLFLALLCILHIAVYTKGTLC